MSWHITLIGDPLKIIEALEAKKNNLEYYRQPSAEFNEALPHLIGLLKLNFNNMGDPLIVRLIAQGGDYTGTDGIKQFGNCTVTIEILDGTIV